MTANNYNSIVNTLSGALTGNNADIQMNMQNVGVLGLRQMVNFNITHDFRDSDGKQWKLVKSANDASVEVPDPQFVQIIEATLKREIVPNFTTNGRNCPPAGTTWKRWRKPARSTSGRGSS